MRWYLVQDYAGGMMIRYAGKYRHKADQRRRDWYSKSVCVIVKARNRAEAWDVAEPLLLKKRGSHR